MNNYITSEERAEIAARSPEDQLAWWRSFFQLPEEDKKNQQHLARFASSGWGTCACCALILERRLIADKQSAPSDQHLDQLGYNFYLVVKSRDWDTAKNLFNEIQLLVEKENALAD